MTKQIITSAMIDEARKRGERSIPLVAGAIITPQALDDARGYGISFVPAAPAMNAAPTMANVPAMANVPTMVATAATTPIVQAGLPVQQHPMMESFPALAPVAALAPAPVLLGATVAGNYAAHALMPGASVPVQAVPAFVGGSCASQHACTQLMAHPSAQIASPSCASEQACAQVTYPQPPTVYTPPSNSGDAVFEEARRRVAAALPPQTPSAEIEKLVRNSLGESYHFCEGCKNTAPCPVLAKATAPSNAVTHLGHVDHVNTKALAFGASHSGAIGLMDVLEPSGDASAHVGYMQGENASMTWTPERSEVLVVIEGRLTLTVNGSELTANIGDVVRIGKGQDVTVTTKGLTRCTLISA